MHSGEINLRDRSLNPPDVRHLVDLLNQGEKDAGIFSVKMLNVVVPVAGGWCEKLADACVSRCIVGKTPGSVQDVTIDRHRFEMQCVIFDPEVNKDFDPSAPQTSFLAETNIEVKPRRVGLPPLSSICNSHAGEQNRIIGLVV